MDNIRDKWYGHVHVCMHGVKGWAGGVVEDRVKFALCLNGVQYDDVCAPWVQ